MLRRWNCSACVKLLPAVTCGSGGSRGWARRQRANCARCRPWAGTHQTLTMAVFLTASPHTMRASPAAASACPCTCQVCSEREHGQQVGRPGGDGQAWQAQRIPPTVQPQYLALQLRKEPVLSNILCAWLRSLRYVTAQPPNHSTVGQLE